MIEFHPSQLVNRDLARITNYRTHLDFFKGTQWEFTTRQRQLVFNYTKVAIEKITAYLIKDLSFTCQTEIETPEMKDRINRAERLLRYVYSDNNLQELDWETEVDCAVLGDACFKVFWDSRTRRVRVTTPDVSGIYAWWLGDDTASIWRVASKYFLTEDEVEILYNVKPVRKKSQITEVWTDKDFQLWLDNDVIEKKVNPYGFIPFVIFPNLREAKQFWGASDVVPMVAPQRELNRALSQLSRILELSGNPIAVLENIREAQDIKVQPGAVWVIPEDAKAYLLDLLQGGGIKLHIDYIDLIYRCVHDITECPRAAYGGVERALSGAALLVELGSLVQKVTRKRTIRTEAYNTRSRFILKLAEKYLGENFSGITPGISWGPILPQDELRISQKSQLLVQSGIYSRRTAMDQIGIQDPDAEFARWMEERAAIRKQNIELPTPSTRGGAITRAEQAMAITEEEDGNSELQD